MQCIKVSVFCFLLFAQGFAKASENDVETYSGIPHRPKTRAPKFFWDSEMDKKLKRIVTRSSTSKIIWSEIAVCLKLCKENSPQRTKTIMGDKCKKRWDHYVNPTIRALTTEDQDQIVRLFLEGKTIRQIAQTLKEGESYIPNNTISNVIGNSHTLRAIRAQRNFSIQNERKPPSFSPTEIHAILGEVKKNRCHQRIPAPSSTTPIEDDLVVSYLFPIAHTPFGDNNIDYSPHILTNTLNPTEDFPDFLNFSPLPIQEDLDGFS